MLLERGWPDLTVDPRRYRLSAGLQLAKQLGRVLPRPDVVLVLDTDASVTHTRKPELGASEIDRQTQAWLALARRNPQRLEVLDARQPLQAVLADAVSRINDRLALRHFDGGGAAVALLSLGTPTREGSKYWVVPDRDRRARWFVSTESASAGLMRSGIFRPMHRRHAFAVLARDYAMRASRGRLGATRLTVDPTAGLAPLISQHLRRSGVAICAAAVPKDGRGRAVLRVCDQRGRLIAYAKVSRDVDRIEQETQTLEQLASLSLTHFRVPTVLAVFDWHEASVVLLEPLSLTGTSDRPLGSAELDTLVELAGITDDLRSVFAPAAGEVFVHGDFAPWNSSRSRDGQLALWDWEAAHLGAPLHDYFHWRFQRVTLASAGTLADIVRSAIKPPPALRALCSRLSIADEAVPDLLRGYLQRSSGDFPNASQPAKARARAIDLLDGRP